SSGVKKHNGWSGFVLIAESHVSLHTFVEEGYLTADVYSCKPFDCDVAVDFLRKSFGFQDVDVNVIKRGLKFSRVLDSIRSKL
ncbi:hypothetical protein LCGC14_2386490, partial [marine sediment metagenome]